MTNNTSKAEAAALIKKESGVRMADLKGKPSTSLAQRAWAAEREWRRKKKLDLKLHRYPRPIKRS
jgi:hypothetical protein